jgi:hypothetical protein
MKQRLMLDLKNISISESDDGLDPTWLNLDYETRLQLHLETLQRGIRLEEAIKGVVIPKRMDKSIHYNILVDAF